MNKTILSVIAFLAVGIACAQEEADGIGEKGFRKGDVFISGSVGYSSEKEGDFKSNTFTIIPQVGFFVSDNIAIGGLLGYTSTNQTISDEDFDPIVSDTFDLNTQVLAIGAFARYYATPASDFSFVGEFGVAYVTANGDPELGDMTDVKTDGFTAAVSPGVSYFISSNFALEAWIGSLQYTTLKPDIEGAESTDTFKLDLNLTDIQFGLVYKF